MEKQLKEFLESRMLQIKKISDELGYPAEILDVEQTEIPTLFISVEKNQSNDNVVLECNLVPTELYNMPVMFLQLYMRISNLIPAEKEKLIDEFISQQNGTFLFGNLLKYQNTVCLKYSLRLDIDDDMDEDLFSRSLDIFILESKVLSSKIFSLLNDEMSLDEALQNGAFLL